MHSILLILNGVCLVSVDPPEKLQQTCPTCPLLLPADSQQAVSAAHITLASYKRQSTLGAGLGVKKITRAAVQVLLDMQSVTLIGKTKLWGWFHYTTMCPILAYNNFVVKLKLRKKWLDGTVHRSISTITMIEAFGKLRRKTEGLTYLLCFLARFLFQEQMRNWVVAWGQKLHCSCLYNPPSDIFTL